MSSFLVRVELERNSDGAEPFHLRADLESAAGLTVLFGPSGAGKSTLLLAVAGALRPQRGRIEVDGRVLFDSSAGVSVPVHRRRIGVVFQDALLFPHLSVVRNVTFGIRGPDRDARARQWLDRVGAVDLASRAPADLSGGERQRVALARALAAEPAALLLDEPFSALDAHARESLGRTIVDLHRDTGVPFLHVTHDLGEAVRLGERLVVLEGGRVVQSGVPAEVAAAPATAATARVLGTENLFAARVLRHVPEGGFTEVDLGGTRVEIPLARVSPGESVTVALRAEDVLVCLDAVRGTSARNLVEGRISGLQPRGNVVEIRVDTPVPVRAVVTPASVRDLGLETGRTVYLLIKVSAFHVVV
jgi:molybdate transport system ATP-binding protein